MQAETIGSRKSQRGLVAFARRGDRQLGALLVVVGRTVWDDGIQAVIASSELYDNKDMVLWDAGEGTQHRAKWQAHCFARPLNEEWGGCGHARQRRAALNEVSSCPRGWFGHGDDLIGVMVRLSGGQQSWYSGHAVIRESRWTSVSLSIRSRDLARAVHSSSLPSVGAVPRVKRAR